MSKRRKTLGGSDGTVEARPSRAYNKALGSSDGAVGALPDRAYGKTLGSSDGTVGTRQGRTYSKTLGGPDRTFTEGKAEISRKNGVERVEFKLYEDDAKGEEPHAEKRRDDSPSIGRKFFDNLRNERNRLRVLYKKTGRTRLFVKGKNSVNALAAIGKICRVSDVEISSEGISFLVPSKLCDKIIALLNNLCYDYKIVKYTGVAPALVRTLSRAGIALGIIVTVAAVAIYPSLVTRVSINSLYGDIDGALNARISEILTGYGVEEGKWLRDIDISSLEKDLTAIDGVAYAGVIRRGTHVVVSIKREQKRESFVEIAGSQVVAKEFASVTRVIVDGGTAAVKYGDVVRPGDLLIAGYVTYGDDKIDVEAKGTVYGAVYERKTVFFADKTSVVSYGRVKRVTKLGMFGKTPSAPKSPFENYELRTYISEQNFLLPIRFYTFEYTETVRSEKENTLSEDEMKRAVYSEMIGGIDEPFRTLSSEYSVSRADGGTYITVTIAIEKVIS